MYKKNLILFLFVLFVGCAKKGVDYTSQVSKEERTLLSSFDDKVIYKHEEIRITEHGFYPDFKIPPYAVSKYEADSPKFYDSKYAVKISSYLKSKKFNLKLFMDDVNKYKLKELRQKLLYIFKKYPELDKQYNYCEDWVFSKMDIVKDEYLDELSSRTLSQEEAKKILAKVEKTAEGKYFDKCDYCYCPPPEPYKEPVYDDYPSGGGSSGSSGGGHYEIQTVYVPGGNGRTAQTGVWVND